MTLPLIGAPAPLFIAPTAGQPKFVLSAVGGRYVMLGFFPSGQGGREEALTALGRHRALLDDQNLMVFGVLRDEETIAKARDQVGLRWFLDRDGAAARLYGALTASGEERPCWVTLDPMLRVLFIDPFDQTEALLQRLAALPRPDDHAGVPGNAPVLIVPRVLDRDFCRQLIDLYETTGGTPSGVMREVNGRTVGVLDDFKRRRDAVIEDFAVTEALRTAIHVRLVPEIEKAFQFKATRIERYIVAAYDADEGGYFLPHRDNTTGGTAHRKFAVTINLNAEDFDGGELRFPEFGSRTYRAPTGGAVVFSCSLLHEATPVTRGRRYATLPFLYDEAGAQVRDRYLASVKADEDQKAAVAAG